MLRRWPWLAAALAAALAGCGAPPPLPFDSAQVPHAVREASACAVQMLIFPPGLEARVDPSIAPKVRADLTSQDIGAREDRVSHVLVDELEASEDERNLGVAGMAWGFIAAEPTCLWTCAHNVDLFFPKIGDTIAIVLLDAEERILFDSRQGDDRATIEHLGTDGRLQMTTPGNEGLLSDYARIRLSRAPCTHTGTLCGSPIAVGERVFLPTNEARGAPARLHAAFSVGQTTQMPSGHDSYNFKAIDWNEQLRHALVFTSAYGAAGLSGSPIFDADGAIVGMACKARHGHISGIRAHRLAGSVRATPH